MATENDIAVRVGADTTALKTELAKGSKSLEKFRSEVNDTAKDMAKFGAAVVAASAVIATKLIKDSLSAIDAQSKLAQSLNTTSRELEILRRAGDLSGVTLDQINNSALKLEINAGKAEQGLMAQKKAFDALGLSAAQLLKMPLSERLSAVNSALLTNVDATQRAAVASDIFGAKNAAAMRLLSVESIKLATEQVTAFGTALSEVDATKVEMANDAMSTVGVAIDGVIKKITVDLAPILKALGDMFYETAKDSTAANDTIENSFAGLIKVIGFVADAMEGVRRVFVVVSNSILGVLQSIIGSVYSVVGGFVSLIDMIPGVKLDGLVEEFKAFDRQSNEIIMATREAVDNAFSDPLPSTIFEQFIKDAETAGQAAAEAAVKARETATEQTATATDDTYDIDFDAEFEANLRHTEMVLAQIERRKRGYEDEMRARKEAGATALSDLSSLMQSENKKQFEIGKKASIVQAAISTVEGAQKAYTSLAGIPYVGPALGIAAAAAAIAAGNMRIQSIKSQQFGGGGSVSSGGGSSAASSASAPQQQQQQMFVHGINPGDMFSGQQLVEIFNKASESGAVLKVAM